MPATEARQRPPTAARPPRAAGGAPWRGEHTAGTPAGVRTGGTKPRRSWPRNRGARPFSLTSRPFGMFEIEFVPGPAAPPRHRRHRRHHLRLGRRRCRRRRCRHRSRRRRRPHRPRRRYPLHGHRRPLRPRSPQAASQRHAPQRALQRSAASGLPESLGTSGAVPRSDGKARSGLARRIGRRVRAGTSTPWRPLPPGQATLPTAALAAHCVSTGSTRTPSTSARWVL